MPNFVLVVDDNPAMRIAISRQLISSGLKVSAEATDGLDAIEKALVFKPDLIILDLSMPRMNGIEAARKLSQICPGVPIILNTLHASVIRSMPSLPEGVTEVVAKNEDLMGRILNLLQMRINASANRATF
ncbi:MAG: response regulator transcription factor [Candidatus Acidiferrales bacterium]